MCVIEHEYEFIGSYVRKRDGTGRNFCCLRICKHKGCYISILLISDSLFLAFLEGKIRGKIGRNHLFSPLLRIPFNQYLRIIHIFLAERTFHD